MITKEQEIILQEVEKILTPWYQIKEDACAAGHDIDHIKRMLAISELIFTDKEVDIFLLKLAIWFHNLDRSKKFNGDEGDFINELLSKHQVKQEDIDMVADAVKRHSHLNTPNDSILLQCLKDCDMLDVGATGILRIAGPRGSSLPLYLPEDFSSKTKDTSEKALRSMIQDIDRCLEWIDLGMIRNAKAREFAKKRFEFMRAFRKEIEEELRELKII